jgi:hypothetical protein
MRVKDYELLDIVFPNENELLIEDEEKKMDYWPCISTRQ